MLQSYVIYHFKKYVSISWNCDTSFGNKILEKKNNNNNKSRSWPGLKYLVNHIPLPARFNFSFLFLVANPII
jgi:hypothetical protein